VIRVQGLADDGRRKARSMAPTCRRRDDVHRDGIEHRKFSVVITPGTGPDRHVGVASRRDMRVVVFADDVRPGGRAAGSFGRPYRRRRPIPVNGLLRDHTASHLSIN
jgi:hypothetical protein